MVTEVLSWRSGQSPSAPSFRILQFAVFSSALRKFRFAAGPLTLPLSRALEIGSQARFTEGYAGAQEASTRHWEGFPARSV